MWLIDVKADLETRIKINDELKVKIEAGVVETERHQIETEKMLSRKNDEIKVHKNSIKTCTF